MKKHFLMLKFVGYEYVQLFIQYLLNFYYMRSYLPEMELLTQVFLKYIYIILEMTYLVLFRDREANHWFYDFCNSFKDS